MKDNSRPTWILHVSDFHINEDNCFFAEWVLNKFAQCLIARNQPVDYVLHSGDIIDSREYRIGFSENGYDAIICKLSDADKKELGESIKNKVESLERSIGEFDGGNFETLCKEIKKEINKCQENAHNEEGYLQWGLRRETNGETSAVQVLEKLNKVYENLTLEIQKYGSLEEGAKIHDFRKTVIELREELRNAAKKAIGKHLQDPSREEAVDNVNAYLTEQGEYRFSLADGIFHKFAENLDITKKRFIFCCGNHDVLRLKGSQTQKCEIKNSQIQKYSAIAQMERRDAFRKFSENYFPVDENNIARVPMHGFEVHLIDTNYGDPNGRWSCADCNNCLKSKIDVDSGEKILRIVLGHKPLYELCETAILPYDDGVPVFLRNVRSVVGENGIYICGDKHTRSISGSAMFEIPHYLGGSPIREPETDKAKVIEYNLIEIIDGQVARERLAKIKLSRNSHINKREGIHEGGSDFFDCAYTFECTICPQKNLVSQIYSACKEYINEQSFTLFRMSQIDRSTWENLSAVYFDKEKSAKYKDDLNEFYRSFLRYRKEGNPKDLLEYKTDIFQSIIARISEKIHSSPVKEISFGRNVLNLRGDYGCGKSTFLGYLYIELLEAFSSGRIDFIPVLFSLNNQEIKKDVEGGVHFCDAAKHSFDEFFDEIEQLTQKEELKILFIIDGLDDQDCWSYTSEDSIGRGIIDILARNPNAWFVMSFTQHRLPLFKNTMPVMKIGDKSDLLYFNTTEVYSKTYPDSMINSDLCSMVTAFIKLNATDLSNEDREKRCKEICRIITFFCRRTINLRFLTEHRVNDFTSAFYSIDSSSSAFRYYIDRQFGICYEALGYNFVKYAPTMAYLFAYHGYTFERFMHMANGSRENDVHEHLLIPFSEYRSMIYKAFLFIKTRKDAREYLIALHYNSELRYYTENSTIPISEKSILNEFIYRNTAVLIRKLWTDSNKLIIVCKRLLERRELPSLTMSMLVYCVANNTSMDRRQRSMLLEKLSASHPKFPDKLRKIFKEETLNSTFNLYADTTTQIRTEAFLHLSFERSTIVFSSESDINELIKRMLVYAHQDRDLDRLGEKNTSDDLFCIYNHQYQMLFYGDQSIHGHDKVKQLELGKAKDLGKGFDIYCTYVHLSIKIMHALDAGCDYRLFDFDLLTLCQLLSDRVGKVTLNECVVDGEDKQKLSGASNSYEYFLRDSAAASGIVKKVKQMVDRRIKNIEGSAFSEEKSTEDLLQEKLEKEKKVFKVCGLSDEIAQQLLHKYKEYVDQFDDFLLNSAGGS